MSLFNSLRSQVDNKFSQLTDQVSDFTGSLETNLNSIGRDIGSQIENSIKSKIPGVGGLVDAFGQINDIADSLNFASINAQRPRSLLNPRPGPIGVTVNPGEMVPGQTPGPWPNELGGYASSNVILELGLLSIDQVNNPGSYRTNGPAAIIARSGGGAGDKKTTTLYEKALGKKVEYFIDNIEMDSLISPTTVLGPTNQNTISFTISEPYSMGMFLETVFTAAVSNGWQTHTEACFLLTIRFVGFDENNSTNMAPYSTRMIPMLLTDIRFSVDAGGSNYQVEAMAWTESALDDNVQTTREDVQITGRTVQELLETGSQSLTSIFNSRNTELESRDQVAQADTYVIIFPDGRTVSSASPAAGSSEDTNSATVVVDPNAATALNNISSIYGNQSVETLNDLVSAEGKLADIANQAADFAGKLKSGGLLPNVGDLAGDLAGGLTQNLNSFGDVAAQAREGLSNLGSNLESSLGSSLNGIAERVSSFDSTQAVQSLRNMQNFKDFDALVSQAKSIGDFDKYFAELSNNATSGSNIGQSIQNFGQTSTPNRIGQATIVEDFLEGGIMPIGDQNFTYDEENNLYNRGGTTVQINDENRIFTFQAGTKVQKIIEEVVITSSYGRDLATQLENVLANDGMVDWFKIETQVYVQPNNSQVARTGEMPKVYVYKVVPYKVHHSRLKAPTAPGAGYGFLKTQAAKEYHYIYTGKNDDILDLDIRFDYQFFQELSADRGQLSQNSVLGNRNQSFTDTPEQARKTGAGSTIYATPEGISRRRETIRRNVMSGGSGIDNNDIAIARMFNRSFTKSETDFILLEMEIKGDPFYICDSGLGNYDALDTSYNNMNADGGMNYQSGEVDVNLVFRTPIDYNESGTMDFPEDTNIVEPFSGLYIVDEVKNLISGNKFTQRLKLRRRPDQSDSAVYGNVGALQPAAPEESLNQQNAQTPGAVTGGVPGEQTATPVNQFYPDAILRQQGITSVPETANPIVAAGNFYPDALLRNLGLTTLDLADPIVSTGTGQIGLDGLGNIVEYGTETVTDAVSSVTDAVSSVTDAVSSATDAATDAATSVINSGAPGFR